MRRWLRWNLGIRLRLMLALLVLAGVGAYLLFDWMVGDLRPRYLEALEEVMVDTSVVLAEVVARQVVDDRLDVETLRPVIHAAQMRVLDARIYGQTKTAVDLNIVITDAHGRVVLDADDGVEEGTDHAQWNDVKRTLRGEYGARSTRGDVNDPRTSVLHVAAPVMVDGRIWGVLTVSKPVASISGFLSAAKRQMALTILGLGLAVVVLGMMATLWVTRPIAQLTAYAHALRAGSRAAPPAGGPPEVQTLGAALAELVDTIEGKREGERAAQALAHEMKSPLASIRGAAELLREQPPAEDRARFLANILGETQRLVDLVERQLALARLEGRRGLRDVADIDLDALCADVAQAISPQLTAKHLRFDHGPACAAVVHGERFLLRQALANLVQNAIDFAPVGSAITITVGLGADGAATLTVDDDGPGIPDYAQARVFERYYSLARPDTGLRSTGLGLSLVREVAALHGGSASLTNRAEGGARATLTLPV